MKQILVLSHAQKGYDGRTVLDDVTLALLPGAKIGAPRLVPRLRDTPAAIIATAIKSQSSRATRRKPRYW